MNRLEIVKAFLSDPGIQQKYSIRPAEVEQLTLAGPHQSVLVGLISRMVKEIEDGTTINTAASQLNSYLENVLRS